MHHTGIRAIPKSTGAGPRTSQASPRRRSVIGFLAASGVLFGLSTVATSAVERTPALGSEQRCKRYSGVPDGFSQNDRAGMVWIEGGALTPGSNHGYPEERGGTSQRVSGFWIDRT